MANLKLLPYRPCERCRTTGGVVVDRDRNRTSCLTCGHVCPDRERAYRDVGGVIYLETHRGKHLRSAMPLTAEAPMT